MFIPSGGSVLVDWGADVIKVEHPVDRATPSAGSSRPACCPAARAA